MKKYLAALSIFFMFISSPVMSAEQSELVLKIRSFVSQIAGEEWATKLFGAVDDINLPAIPKIEKDAKKVVERKDEKANKIPADQAKKLDYGYVLEVYDVTRRSKPTQKEMGDWMNVLSQGATREGVYRALVLDQTYYGLENFQKPVSDKVAEFASEFMQKYLGQATELEKLKAANFYTMKRVLTEKSLDIIDALLESNPEDCYRWYAVLSADIGGRYPKLWKNDLRKSDNKQQQLDWARAVPEQHLKSEIIIKLHTVFNALQG